MTWLLPAVSMMKFSGICPNHAAFHYTHEFIGKPQCSKTHAQWRQVLTFQAQSGCSLTHLLCHFMRCVTQVLSSGFVLFVSTCAKHKVVYGQDRLLLVRMRPAAAAARGTGRLHSGSCSSSRNCMQLNTMPQHFGVSCAQQNSLKAFA